LIALLERPDERTAAITSTLPTAREIVQAAIDLLPDEGET
jgi:hypothetical protein